MKPLAPNTMIQNRYLVVQAIGKGGMGEVYLAVDQRLGSAVALKRTFFNDDEMLNTAFEREARILARLRHPVLPKVIDHFAENGDQYLVMEHISGDDLSKRLENAKKPFPLSWVMFWADQMLDALSYLHSHEPPIIHRDIKPQNLKLTDENHVVLLDFGLSKDFDTSTTGNPLNSASVAGYSPHFASMEQIRGTGTDARSDLYSFAATLYQLLTNSIPLDALSRADAMLGGGVDPIVSPTELNPEVPQSISDVVVKGVALRQDQRFATAGEMQKALRRAFNQGTAEAGAASLKPDLPAPAVNEQKVEMPPPDSGAKTNDVSASILEATLEMDRKTEAEALRQADIKTEVFSKAKTTDAATTSEKMAAETSVMPVGLMADAQTEENVSVDAKTEEHVPVANETPGGPSIPTVAHVPAEPPPPPVQEQHPPAMAAAAAAGAVSVAAPKKKSKAGLIVGVLVGLVLLAGIAGAAAWFGYNKYVASQSTPTPTPAVTPAASPSVPVVAETNQNTNSNTSTVGLTEANTETPAPNRPVSMPPQPGSTRPTPQQPVATKDAPPRTAPTQVPKTAPKGGKPKDERTVILQ